MARPTNRLSDQSHPINGVTTVDHGSPFPSPAQWALLETRATAGRGAHVHLLHHDLIEVVHGELIVGVCDTRPRSSSRGTSFLFSLTPGCAPVTIPPGVVHAFYAPVRTQALLGTTETHDPADELACAWDDPDLGLSWDAPWRIVSDRDRSAGPFAALAAAVEAADL